MKTILEHVSGVIGVAALAALILGGCAGVDEYTWYDAAKTNGHQSEFTIAPGDQLQVDVWQQEDLSGPVRVRSDGFITVPLVGDVGVAGKTPSQAAQVITQKVKNVVLDPRVAVMVVEARPLRIGVLGQVERPGFYELERGSGILQALAQAGGLSAFADASRIFVVTGHEKPVRFTFKELVSGRAAYLLRPSDTVLVE